MIEEPSKQITLFAETNFRSERKRFGIKRDDRRRHVYIIGKTGMGKTTLLENMVISDIINGEGCCYIDPHGDTAEKLLDFIPSDRINDVIYFDPAETDFPIAFNILEAVDEKSKHLIASGLVGVFKKQFADSWGPRLEYILRNAILALLDYPGSTLLGIMRILVDDMFRKKVVDKIKDPVVKSFWTNEYTKWNDRVLQEVISPIQNKVGQFLSNFLIRNIVGQVKSTIDMREIIDGKKILILNLSKGRIGEDTMQLLGSMIVTKLYLAAMSRVDVLEENRKDFFLYVDEFQNFATDSFADILSEARKYRLNLTIAHQFILQLPETVAAAVFGNVGTMMCFRVGAADAEELVKEFTPTFTEEDLVNLPSFNIYLKLMIDGIASDPFSAATLPPLFDDIRTGSSAKVRKVSHERYANPRSVVEEKINRWSGMILSEKVMQVTSGDSRSRPSPTSSASVSYQSKASANRPKAKKKEFEAICSNCGNKTLLNFKPDDRRPIFCDDCFTKVKDGKELSSPKKFDSPKPDLTPKPAEIKKDNTPTPELSLSDALGKAPVNFGNNSKPKEEIRRNETPANTAVNNQGLSPGKVVKM